ncbi:MAG: DUF1003 domain-containing protein [Gemmatimonadaceae bacterium]
MTDEQTPSVGDTMRASAADDNPERRKRRYVANLAFGAIKAQHSAHRTILERAVDKLNEIASSVWFLVAHLVGFTFWILWNTGEIGLQPVDPYPFGLMTTIVSLEAIFLSIFVLMAQQRESTIAELREELGLQVNLRVEQEVTKTLQLVAGLYTRLGHRVSDDPELNHMLQPLDVRAIERDLLEQIEAATSRKHHNTMLDDADAGPRTGPSAEPPSTVLR